MVSQEFIKKNLYNRTVLSYLLLPLSGLYSFAQIVHRNHYKIFKPQRQSENVQVVSVGNITAGGSGKTPFTIFLAELLMKNKVKTAVCLRGYKGDFEESNRIISSYDRIYEIAGKAGDEAQLLASKLPGVPIAVGRNRALSVNLLVNEFKDLDVIILDDAFQHLKVHQDHRIVLFNKSAGLGNGFVIPAGILREPLSALKDADFFVCNGGDIKGLPGNKKTYTGKYVIDTIYNLNGEEVKQDDLQGKSIGLLSGLGFPESFEKTVNDACFTFNHHFRYPDHFNYTSDTMDSIRKEMTAKGLEIILTTEKDYTKLSLLKSSIDFPVYVVAIKYAVAGAEEILRIVTGR